MGKIWDDFLMHVGVKYRSGRYPYGSGEDPYQHDDTWLGRYSELKSAGLSDKEIANALGMTAREMKDKRAAERQRLVTLQTETWRSEYEHGASYNDIGAKYGVPASTVASRLAALKAEKETVTQKRQRVIDILKEEMKKTDFLDVGAGVAQQIGCTDSMLTAALKSLEDEGYMFVGSSIPQVGRIRQQSNTKVLISPDIAEKCQDFPDPVKEAKHQVYLARDAGNLKFFAGDMTIDPDSGEIRKLKYPQSIDSKRIDICYAEQGGVDKDGVIEIRRNVPDLSLGNSKYAQVRILVDGDHYLKGMACYADDLPDGVDIRFNTNKSQGTPKMKVLKEVKPENANSINPFGAYYDASGQSEYDGADGQKHLSAINKLKSEGAWDEQRVRVPSQMLSKQSKQLAQKQLKETVADYKAEFDEIMSNTNAVMRQKMLEEFADKCDTASIHLHAKAFPGQRTQVILPIRDIKDNEVFAPNYDNGTTVALIRYPHGGTFEIPILKVNNKNKEGVSTYGLNAVDMVGINKKVADRLSGADFDGDTVAVIPLSNSVHITSTPQLSGLKDFDPKTQYAERPGMKYMNKKDTQKQMGIVSNLITDMHIKGAPLKDIELAVKHSMVVIDAEKHKLDYKQSEKDNEIARLKRTYQEHTDPFTGETKYGGAATLLSLAKNPETIPERRGSGHIDKETGVKTYEESGKSHWSKKEQKMVPNTIDVPKMSLFADANKLSTGTDMENLYANYANAMKAYANKARKEAVNIVLPKKDPHAAEVYKYEVESIEAKVNNALKNSSRERAANALAKTRAEQQFKQFPDDFDKYSDEGKKKRKKVEQIEIERARVEVGSKSQRFALSEKEYEAIEAGAMSGNKIRQVLRYVDNKDFAEHTRPKTTKPLSNAQIARIENLKRSGYTNAEIADSLRVSESTITKYLIEEKKGGDS